MMTLEEMKEKGEACEWLDQAGYDTIRKGYLLDGETQKQMYRRVAKAAARHSANPAHWEEK